MLLFFGFLIVIGWIFSYMFASRAILYVFVAISLAMNFLSYYYSHKLVIALTGARPLSRNKGFEVYEIVEKLSREYKMPMPKIYITDDPQANAFATGRDEKHAIVAVTKGILERLNRDELEGVLAHELSHIKNRDILVGTIAVMLAGIIAMISDIFLRMTLFGGLGRRDNREGGSAVMLIVAVIAAILAPIAAMMIRFAISRKRETLADISGSQLTKKPENLANALIKISQDTRPLLRQSSATSHLYIENPARGKQTKSWFVKLFMTHPPIEERIKMLHELQV